MSKFKVLAIGNITPEALDFLQKSSVLTVERYAKLVGPALWQALSDVDGLIIRTETPVTQELLDRAPKLKAICRAGTGVDHIDIAACTTRKIVVMNTPEANRTSAAEHTFGLLLALAKKIPQSTQALKAGRWDQRALEGIEIAGKTLGIIGLGNIGQRVAVRAQVFGMNVIACDPYLDTSIASKIGVKLMLLDEVLKQSDFVTLHVPLTDETRKMVDGKFLSAMKPQSFLINAARGQILDETSLVDVLKSKKLQGAALDVFENEPLKFDFGPENELLKFENVIATPHTAGKSLESQKAMSMNAAQQIRKFFEQGVSSHVVLKN